MAERILRAIDEDDQRISRAYVRDADGVALVRGDDTDVVSVDTALAQLAAMIVWQRDQLRAAGHQDLLSAIADHVDASPLGWSGGDPMFLALMLELGRDVSGFQSWLRGLKQLRNRLSMEVLEAP